MIKNFYEVLDLPRDVTQKDLVARFRQLVRERHPDRFHGEEKAQAELAFQNITEAFNILRDPQRRLEHDRALDRPTDQGHDPAKAALVFLKRGIKAYKEQNLIQAADNFERATQGDPENHQAWHHLALVCMQEERWWEKAEAAIVKACDLKENHLPYLKLAGKIFLQSGKRQQAIEYYTKALPLTGETDPSVRQTLRKLGAMPK